MLRAPVTLLIAAGLCLAVGLALAPAGFGAVPERAEKQEIGLLFSQTATRGTLKQVEGKSRFALVLKGVTRQTVWFQDRPGRQTGHIPTRDFVRAWGGLGFRDDPPNAALTLLDAADHKDTVVLELRRPRYQPKTRTLRYQARRLHEASDNLSHLESRRDDRIPRRFKDATLFIDDASAPVTNGCLIQPYAQCSGADLRNAALYNANLYNADLSAADLTDARLNFALLVGANLTAANLTRADLNTAKLATARLGGANLYRADLNGVGLYRADLTEANLTGARLTGTDLWSANLTDANLTDAHLTDANLTDTSFTGAKLCHTTMPDRTINNRDC